MTEAVLSTGVAQKKAVRRVPRKLGTTGAVVGIVVALVVAWQLAVSAGWINGKLLGSPSGIYEAAVIGLTQGTLVSDTWVTLYETLAGLAIGSGLGIALGLLLWFLPAVSGVAEGLSVILNSIPKIALGPLIVIWFGSDASSKIWLAGISTFAVAMISSCAAAREVDKDLLNLFHSFKARPSMIFTKLIVPSALPWIFSTLRVNIGFALIGAVVGEYIASQSGLGHAVFVAGSLFDLNTVWLGIIVLTVMASVLSWIVQLAEAKNHLLEEKMKKTHALLNGIAAGCLVAFGIGANSVRAAEPVVIYQAFQSIQYLPLYVAIDKGIFEKNGLAVQKVTAGSGAAGVAAVIGGHADFSLQDPMTAMLANLKGASLVNVANVVAGVPVWVITPKDSKVKGVGDLAGKSVSTALPPSTSTYLLQRLISEQKLADVKMNTVQIGTELAPVTAGRSEAAALYMPQAETGLAQGYRIVYAFPKAYPGGYAFSTIDTLASTVKTKPKMVAAFVKSIGEAEALIQQSHDTAKSVARAEFPSLDPAIVDSAVQRLIDQKIYAATPDISEQAFRNALDLQESIGNIKPGAITYANGVDNTFAAAVSK